MSDYVQVSRAALEAFIKYADRIRDQLDCEFCVTAAEHKQSEDEFTALVDALYPVRAATS
jgi:hypothetical protein